MELNYKEMIKALSDVEDQRNIPMEVIIDALKDAMAKAYKKDAELTDIDVVAEINEKKKTIDLFQNLTVVENESDVEDDELQISLHDAREFVPDIQVGDIYKQPIEITTMSRAAATLARNVMRQKIREAEKVAVYNEYISQLHEMVLGIVESVKERFALVNLGKTVAMMPGSAQIPGELLTEGQKIRVVITDVKKDTKGSQVLVSRGDAMLVRRLFEKEVPEIFQGIVEIKAIAREPGERTKMAVLSHNAEVDPIGACIGPRGNRVQEIIEELHGEKIDIFQWSDDITELVKNALAPADIVAVVPNENSDDLMVIVDEDQLSLAIGKRGKNARLAVKLTNHKIDIKTREDIEEMGLDYDQLLVDAARRREELRREHERREIERLKKEAKEAEERRLEAAAKLVAQSKEKNAQFEEEDIIPEEMQEHVQDMIRYEMAMETEAEKTEAPKEEETVTTAPAEEPVSEPQEEPEVPEEIQEEEPEADEPQEEVQEPVVQKRRHADLEDMANKSNYVSVFEKLADTSKPKEQEKSRKKKKKTDDDEYKVRNKDLEKQLKQEYAMDNRPIYTEEELAEIEEQQRREEEREYDIDYDEYDDYDQYYDDEDNI